MEWIATLCGHGLDPLFDAVTRAGVRLIDTRNEQSAAYIAECYGRLTGKPGVCASSSGVAVVNAMTGVMNAWFDHAPMLFISGSADLDVLGRGCFQDADQAALVRPLTKYSHSIERPEDALPMLDEAWSTALETPCGPVHLMFPMNVQRAIAASDPAKRTEHFQAAPPSLTSAAEALRLSRRPLILTTSEVFYNGEGGALLDMARRFHIPVQTPIWDRGICDFAEDVFLGVMGAATGDAGLLKRADCVLLAGDLRDYRVQYLKDIPNVHIVARDWAGLARMAGPLDFTAWLSEARGIRDGLTRAVRNSAEAQRAGTRMHAVDIVDVLADLLPTDASLIIDGGSIGQWAHHLLCERRYPGYWLTCGRSGVVGFGIAGAIAARLAFPQRPVVLLSGDGAFTFSVADLECAVRQRLHFVAIVADDQCWGITDSGHLRQYGKGMATRLGPIAFDRLADSFGASGVRAGKREELAAALQHALSRQEVTIIHVPISGGAPQAA